MTAHSTLKVLVVENDWLVRTSVMDMLDDLGHTGTAVPTGEKALRLLHDGDPVDLMLLDIGLPDMDGCQLAAKARDLRPELRIVFVSGYGPERLRAAANDLNAAYLHKPYLLADLRKAVNGYD